ncbi:MAG: hypothetical protein GY814_12120 [Gammaproteobacteria bacterium]|nr:hypothetical protein [Gammaproteobacteria bacterium]
MSQKPRQDIFDIIDACADQLEHLNQAFPGLASNDTHTAFRIGGNAGARFACRSRRRKKGKALR